MWGLLRFAQVLTCHAKKDVCSLWWGSIPTVAVNKKLTLRFALASQGLKAPTIAKELKKENLLCSRVGVHKFLLKFEGTGSITRR